MTDSMKTHLQFMDQAPQPALPMLEFDLNSGKDSGVDYAETLSRLAREARQQQETAGSRNSSSLLFTDEVSFHLESVSQTFGGLETPTDRKLNEAKELINQEEYGRALELLGEVLSEHPDHHEAQFLAATCEHGLERNTESLERLLQIRTSGATPAMLGRIDMLCEKIREIITPQLFAEVQQDLVAGNGVQAAERVSRMIELDPKAAMFHYLLTIVHLTNGDAEQAYRASEQAVAVGKPHEKARLLALQKDIRERLARLRMAPAVALFKQQKHRQARKALRSIDEDIQRSGLWKNLDRFFAQCADGKADQPPQLSYPEAEAMYEVILSEELPMIRKALAMKEPAIAERIAGTAAGWLPHYCYVCFLYANAIYCRLGEQLSTNDRPELSDMLAQLWQAAELVETSLKDPEIKAAPVLKKTLEEILTHLEEQKRESEIVNPVISEFVTIMESAKGGIGSKAELDRARNGLEKLKGRIARAKKKVNSKPAREALENLAEAVSGNLKQLAGIEGEIVDGELIAPLFRTFNTRMKGLEAQGGISSPGEARTLKREFEALKVSCESARRRVSADASRKTLDNLIKAVEAVLGQLASF